jgi:hypothetical protein
MCFVDSLHLLGAKIVDSAGREVLLRGVNLAGSSKLPTGQPTHYADDFSGHRAVSFVGRPFPRDEACRHFERLRHWGFNVLRFLVTWEAIEHAGPRQYDNLYLDYVAEMVALAGEYGLYVYIDPHQDVWSRMTGGDGAPGWTLELAGFNLATLDLSEAAITMQRRYPRYPKMVWTNNYNRLACCTMFTLFFMGRRFAPHVMIDGQNIQDYLQDHYIAALGQVAERLRGLNHVLGYGAMNEPGKGYIGLKSLGDLGGFPQQDFLMTPAETFFVGAGLTRGLPALIMQGFIPVPTGEVVTVNPHRISAWSGADIWRDAGIWDVDAAGEPHILRDDYFAEADFVEDALLPFMQRYIQALRQFQPNAWLFVEGEPNEVARLRVTTETLGAVVNAGHWYDLKTLFTKQFDGQSAFAFHDLRWVEGLENVRAQFVEDIARLVRVSQEAMGGVPTWVGEFGLAYDMNARQAYQDGDFSLHELALSLYYDAMDANLVHSTLWNYTPDNSNAWGDSWNNEDLSIFSPDQQSDPQNIHSGGRAVRGFCRPYVRRCAGQVLSQHFDSLTGRLTLKIMANAALAVPTEVYLPEVWYPHGYWLEVSSGKTRFSAGSQQILLWDELEPGEQTFVCYPA